MHLGPTDVVCVLAGSVGLSRSDLERHLNLVIQMHKTCTLWRKAQQSTHVDLRLARGRVAGRDVALASAAHTVKSDLNPSPHIDRRAACGLG